MIEEIKCQICNKKVVDNSHYINGKYYHNDCIEQLQQENEAMKQLIEWIEECDFGFDNFVNDYEEDINMTEEEFDKETENMSYIESMIHYAKLYIKTKGMKKIKCMIGFLEVDKNQNEALIEFLVKNKIQFHVIKANDEYIKENLKLESDK